MKSIIYFLIGLTLSFIGGQNLHAQEVDNPQAEFLDKEWYLTKMVVNEEDMPFIPNEFLQEIILFADYAMDGYSEIYLTVTSCEWGSTGLEFTEETKFITLGGLDVLSSDNDQDCDWDYHFLLFEDFWGDTDYEYTITQWEENQELVIENSNGDRTYYQDVPYMSVNDQQISNMTLYPNPTKDFLYIESLTEPVHIEIYDLSGKVMLSQEVNEANKQVNVSQLSEGIFLYQFSQNGQKVKTGKLVKN